MIDLVLLLVLIGYAISGFRQGAVVGFLSLAGFVGGGAVAMWLLPQVLPDSLGAGRTDVRWVLLLLAGVVITATLGQALAVGAGMALRGKVRDDSVRLLDSVLGAVASTIAVCVLVWLVAGAVRGGPSTGLSRAVGQSRVVTAVDAVLPSSGGRVFAGFRSLLDAEGFPRVFAGFGTERIRAVAPPDPAMATGAAVRRAAAGVVKITGTAPSCKRSQEGTGWVLERGIVVTNAHVVAGVQRPRVQVGGIGESYPGRVVVFDPARDLAVINIDGLPSRARPLPVGPDLSSGDGAVVAGFPKNGPYKVGSARVRDVITARGEDIYGKNNSTRQVYSLYARVQPGNSGGPLLDRRGQVVGIVFAKSLDDDSTGYALTMDEAAPVLEAGRVPRAAVSTGACATG
jgi:S1-C subfamily serine protease